MLNLVPRPKEISESGADFALKGAITIVDRARAKDAAVAQLVEALKRKTRRTPKVTRAARSPRAGRFIVLQVDPANPSLNTAESYLLSIDRNITVTGRDAAGLFYGVQTLRQILRKSNGILPGTLIRDWPDYTERILMYDLARQQHVRIDYLSSVFARAAELKYNKLMLYLEGRFAFPSHPLIGPKGSMTPAQARQLERTAKSLHIELIPQFNCLGHNEIVLGNPLYAHLAEDQASPYQLCASNPESVKLVKQLTTDMARAFHSPMFHAGGDETGQLGRCQKCAKSAQKLGPAALYARYYLKVIEHVKSLGKTVAIWGDEMLRYRELADLLPKDVVIYDWHYSGSSPQTVKFFRDKGFPVTVCPSASAFSAGTVPYDRPTENVLTFLPDAYHLGVRSMCMTVWEMYRGSFMQNNWYPVALAADTAWNTLHAQLTTGHLRSFQRRFCRVFLGSTNTTFFDYLRLVAHGDGDVFKSLLAHTAHFRRAFFTDPDPFFLYLRFGRDLKARQKQAWGRFFRKAERLLGQAGREATHSSDMLDMVDLPMLVLKAAYRRITSIQAASEIYRKLYVKQRTRRPSTVRRGLTRCRQLVEGCATDCETLEKRLLAAHEQYGSPWEDVLQMRRHAAHFRTYARYIRYHEQSFDKGVPLVEPSALYL